MKLYRVQPEPGIDIALSDPEFSDTISHWYAPLTPESLRVNIVSTPLGDLSGLDGGSASISNPVDRALLRILRHNADAVLVGAATTRQEVVPVPARAPLVIISASGDLSGHRIPPSSLRPKGVIVITGPTPQRDPLDAFPTGSARHLRLGVTTMVDPALVRDQLRREGFRHLLLEGGGTILRAFLDALVVDELALTLTGAPRSSHQPPLPWWQSEWGHWESVLVATDSGKNLYFRFTRAG